MNRALTGLAAASVVGFLAATSAAAYPTATPVTINSFNSTATGMMGAAWNSSDQNQLIVCAVVGLDPSLATGSPLSAYCYAVDSAGDSASCSLFASSASPMILALSALTPDAELSFSWDSGGYCTAISVTVQSANPPK